MLGRSWSDVTRAGALLPCCLVPRRSAWVEVEPVRQPSRAPREIHADSGRLRIEYGPSSPHLLLKVVSSCDVTALNRRTFKPSKLGVPYLPITPPSALVITTTAGRG